MRRFRTLSVKGLPLFEEQSFDLSKPGVSVILGLNLNSARRAPTKGKAVKATSEGDNTNGVGKSLFFSQLFELFFKEGSTGNAKDKIKAGEVTLDLDVGKTAYSITKYLKGKSEKYRVLKNGVDTTPANSVEEQRQLVLRILGRTPQSFGVVDYLDNTKPHLLRTGDTAQRRQFFTEFFDLESADTLRKLVMQERNALRKQVAVLHALKEQLSLSADSKQRLADAKTQLSEVETKLESTTAKLDVLKTAKEYEEYASANSKLRNTLVALGYSIGGTDFDDRVNEHVQLLESAAECMRDQAAYDKAVSTAASRNEARSDYLTEKGLTDYDDDKAEGAIDAATEHHDKLSATTRDLARVLSETGLRLRSVRGDIESNSHKRSKLKSSLTCPTCGQPTTPKHIEEETEALSKERNALKVKLKALNDERLQQSSQLEDSETIVASWRAKLDKLLKRRAVYRAAPKQVGSIPDKPSASAMEALRASSFERMPKRFTASDLHDRASKLRGILRELELASRNTEHWERLLNNEKSEVDTASMSKLTDRALKLTERLGTLRAQVEAMRERLSERRALRTKIQDLEAQLGELDTLDLLDKAFSSSSGIKQMVINTVCRSLEAQVNKYAKFLFPEDFMFEFDLSTQFNITCTRTIGDNSWSSDVRKLSGAEAGMFNLLLAISLMSFLPPNKRCNVLILDELNANFGPDADDKFWKFLSVLSRTIPHIVVITPKPLPSDNTFRVFTVVKRGSQSRIELTYEGANNV